MPLKAELSHDARCTLTFLRRMSANVSPTRVLAECNSQSMLVASTTPLSSLINELPKYRGAILSSTRSEKEGIRNETGDESAYFCYVGGSAFERKQAVNERVAGPAQP